MQPKAFAGQTCQNIPSYAGVSAAGGGFDSVGVGMYNQEEKVERRHRRDGDQEMKKKEEREERKDREEREKEKERKWGGEEEKWGRRASETVFL